VFKKITLPSGLRVVTAPMSQVDSVTALILVQAGSRYENAKNNGVSHFLEHMTFKGTKKRPNKLALTSLIDSVGGIYNAFTTKEDTGFYIKAPSRHLDLILDVLSDTLINSLYDPAEIAKEKGVITEEINMYEDEPSSRVWEILEKLLYDNQPLGMRVLGEKETVANLTREQIIDYVGKMYQTGSVVVGLAGNINEKSVDLVKRYMSPLAKGTASHFDVSIANQSKPSSAIYFKESDQAHLVLACRGYPLSHPDRYVTGIMATLLGGYMSSRLFIEVRDKRGLAYYVGAAKDEFADVGYFATYAGVRVADTEEAVKVILEELAKLKEKKVTEEELKRAKENWKGRMELALEDSYRVASFYAAQELFEKEIKTSEGILEEADRVTAEDVQRVAKDIFVNQKLNLAVVGPFKNEGKFDKLLKI